MDVPVYNMKGAQVSTLSIDEQSLGGEVRPALIKQAYVRYHTNQRQGSSRTKNRREVEGSTRKIYKQKGTGNARHGDRRPNLFKGGGHGHSKKRTREDFRPDMPKKMRRKANRNALLAKLVDSEVRIVDRLELGEARTRAFTDFLGAVKIDASALVALGTGNAESIRLSARNVDGVTLCRADQLNCFELLNHRYLVIAKADLEAWLKGPWSQTDKSAKLAPLGREAAKPHAKAAKEAA
ncbi:MAG: 50S ribosomal protein L4 [Phycisphaerales bacterium]